MAKLSPGDIAQVASNAGFSGQSLSTAVAVALAESGGDPNAVGQNPGSRDRGLWQINDRWHSEVSDACAFDPNCAAGEAYRISSQGRDFGSWVTWVSGAYKTFLQDAQNAAGAVLNAPGQAAGQLAGQLNPLQPIADAINTVTGKFLSGAQVLAGGFVLLAGAALAVYLVAKRVSS